MRMSKNVTGRAAGVAVLLAVAAGCSVLEPRPDGSRYFMLRSMPDPASPAPPLEDLVLGLGPVTVPAYLDQNEMLDLVGPYELKYSAQNRWVEPLGDQIYHTLANNLHAELGADAIVAHPWYASDGVDLQVDVSFDPIRLDPSGAWSGGGAWVVRNPETRVALERNSFDFVLGSDSIPPEDIARGISDELGQLATEIASGVRRHYTRQETQRRNE